MKTHLTKLPLALLSVAFLLGCQDQGSEPVGPEGLGPQFNKPSGGVHDHGDTENPEGPNVGVTLTGGIMTTMGQELATLSTDNRAGVSAFSSASFFAKLNLTPTEGTGSCTIEQNDGGGADLLAAFLTKDIGAAENAGIVNFNLSIRVKKETGNLSLSWFQPAEPFAGEHIRVGLSSKDVTGDADRTEFTFQGGAGGRVMVQRFISEGTLTERDRLTCPFTGPAVEILLDRSP